MIVFPTIRIKTLSHLCAQSTVRQAQRRGWLNVWPGIDVNSDQNLNTGKPDKLCDEVADAELFGVSGGNDAGLIPSLAH